MRMVCLDGFTLTPNEPDRIIDDAEPVWDAFTALDAGDLKVHARTAESQVVERVGDATAVLTNKTPISAKTITALPKLRYIGVLATGTNIVDLGAARLAGVTVTNVPAYSAASVAQQVFALLLELTNRVGAHDAAVHRGEWVASTDFSFTVAPIHELAGKSLGIVGLGDIGSAVARIAHAFGMRVLVHSRTQKDIGVPVEWRSLDELFAESDAVTLHCPLTEATKHLVNAQRLATMKPTAYLINTGRGPLLDEAAVAGALRAGGLAGAGLDVLSVEPPKADNPLLAADIAERCIITPHVAWASREARFRLMAEAAANLRAYLEGKPRNVVNR